MTQQPEFRPDRNYILGLDLGQAADFTALACIEIKTQYHQPSDDFYDVRHLQRFLLGTTYPDIVTEVGKLLSTPPLAGSTTLVLDLTGVGRPVRDLFEARNFAPVSVTITGGTTETDNRDGSWSVPKHILVSNLQVLLGSHRLSFAANLPDVPVLVRELLAYKVKITPSVNAVYGNGREAPNDDLVLALALGCWWEEKGADRGLVIGRNPLAGYRG